MLSTSKDVDVITSLYDDTSSITPNNKFTQENNFHLFILDIVIRVSVCIILIIGLILNSLILYLIYIHKGFHKPYMYVRLIFIILDFLFALIVILQSGVGVVVSTNCLLSVVIGGLYFMTIQLTAFLAVERYFYFCKPLAYTRLFTGRSIFGVILLIFCLCFGYQLATEMFVGRLKHLNVNICTLPNQRMHNAVQLLIFFIPAIMCTLISVFKIKKLLTQLEMSTYAAPPSLRAGSTSFGPAAEHKTGQKALR